MRFPGPLHRARLMPMRATAACFSQTRSADQGEITKGVGTMNNVRLAVIYYSTYGTNHQMAEIAAEAARAAGAEVRLLRVAETAPEGVVAGQDAWRAHAEKTKSIP